MFPPERVRTLCRFVRQEGITSTALRALSGVAGLVYRSETAYILSRPATRECDAPICPEGVTIELLRDDQIDQLAMVGYSEREEIARRIQNGQTCIIAQYMGDILHYSWLTSKSEYAGELEMVIPVEAGETYLYNCRTLAQARGKGIFPAVIARALEEAGKSGASVMLALVSKHNEPSLKAFEKMMFRVREETRLFRFLTVRKHYSIKHNNL